MMYDCNHFVPLCIYTCFFTKYSKITFKWHDMHWNMRRMIWDEEIVLKMTWGTYRQNPYWLFRLWSMWTKFWCFRKVGNSFKYLWNVCWRRCCRRETTTTNIKDHAEKHPGLKATPIYHISAGGGKRGFLSSLVFHNYHNWCLFLWR